jgi:hypothetical protein
MQQFDYPAVIAATWNALGYLAWGWSLPVDRRPAGTKAPAAAKAPTDDQREPRIAGIRAPLAKSVDAT